MTKHIFTIMALGISGILLGGCAANKASYSGDIKDDPVAIEEIAADDTSAAVSPNFAELPKSHGDQRSDPKSLLINRTIYFEYDKAIVPLKYLDIINAHIYYLVDHPKAGIVLAGNTDDRGSNEYNLALGQRRADAVRDLMLESGIPQSQLESISFGEEMPAALGNNEAAWRENRRVDIRYTDE